MTSRFGGTVPHHAQHDFLQKIESDNRVPSQSNEKRGNWVGFADNEGDHLTWKILTDETQQMLPDLLLEVPTKFLLTSGRINHKI